MNVQKALEHPEAFFKMFLHEHLYGATTAAPFHSELFDLLYSRHRVIIAAPRAHAKSTICSFAYPIWAAISQSKHEIIIVSKTASLAEKWLDKIQFELTGNEQIRNISVGFSPRLKRALRGHLRQCLLRFTGKNSALIVYGMLFGKLVRSV